MAGSLKFPLSTAQAGLNRPGGRRSLTGIDGEIVCYCNDLYAAEVEQTIRANGLTRVAEVVAITHKDDPCALCSKRIEMLLARVNEHESFIRALMQPDYAASVSLMKVGRA